MSERRALPYDPKEIKRRLQDQLPGVLSALGIHEPIRGGVVTPLNRWRVGGKPDRKAGSFVIWTDAAAAGAWREYAGSDADAGSIWDLILYTQRLHAWIDAYWWALNFLGLERHAVRSAEQAALERKAAEQDRIDAARLAAAQDKAKSDRLFRWWLTLPPIPGTLAWRYLIEARGIPMQRMRRPPGALRFAAALDHIDEATGEVTSWPAMVAAVTRESRVVGLHRTYLARDGLGKAPVAGAKKMSGSVRGGQIWLTRGAGGLTPNAADKKGRTTPGAVGEGIETALTVALAKPDWRVAAAGSLSLMGLMTWPDCVSAMTLLRDNDWGPQPQAAFNAAARHWRAQARGRPLAIAASAVGSDFNDWRETA